MKRVMVMAAILLLVTALAAVPEQALARSIIVLMADQTGDNIFELEVTISDSKYKYNKFEMISFRRGVNLKMVKDDRPPLRPCEGSGALRGSGNARKLVFGDEEDITEADIELSFKNMDTYKLEFYWLDPSCHRSALIEVVPKQE